MDKSLPRHNGSMQVEEVLVSEDPILDVFWYSASSYVIVVTEKYINVAELRGEGRRNAASLYKFDAKPRGIYYDETSDSLYFIDAGKDRGSKDKNYLYRLELRQTFFARLMQLFLKKEEAQYEER